MTYEGYDRGTKLLRRQRLVLAGHMTVVVVVLAIWIYSGSSESSSDALVRPLSGLFVALTVWVFASWRMIGRSIFDPYAIFVLAAVLFNGGQMWLEVFGLNPNGMLDGLFGADTIVDAQLMVISGVATLHGGALMAVSSARGTGPSGTDCERHSHGAWSCRAVGICLLIVSIVPALQVAKTRFATVYASGYYALYQQDLGTGFEGAGSNLAEFLIPGALFLLAGSRDKRPLRIIAFAVVGSSALLLFFAGNRGHAAMPLIAYAWLRNRVVRPLPKSLLLSAGALTMFVLFPLLREIRDIRGADRTHIQFVREAYLSIDNPPVAIVSEMGASVITLAYTLELVPSTRPFDYGLEYLYALSSALPNVFWDVHPATVNAPSDWLIWTVDPFTARTGGGLGYSFIAEAYLNFGSVGVPLIMAAIGFLYCRFVLWADSSTDPARFAAVASFVAFTLFYARGEALFVVRPLLWYSAMPYLACRFLVAFLVSNSPGKPRPMLLAARDFPR